MADANTHINYSLADIHRYLSGSLSAKEMHDMERAALEDPFLADALEGYGEADMQQAKMHLAQIETAIRQPEEQAKVIALPAVKRHRNWKMSKTLVLTTINTMDGSQSAYNPKTTYQRFTSGGRLELQTYNWYLTTAAYYQYGKDSSGKKLSAFYIQPEIKYSTKTLAIRLGMEYLSGQDSSSSKDNNFVPLYGVAHRFMGNLDLFTTFPSDVKNGGLINPYLFFQYTKNKWNVRLENHLFYSHTGTAFKGMPTNNKYLGFENDWRINFKPTPIIDLEYGFCWASVTNSMIEVKNSIKSSADIDKYSKTPYWSYLSIKITPVIGKISF